MEQSGVLGKRFRRTIAKVHGLTNIPYHGTEDCIDGITDQRVLSSTSRKSATSLNLSSSEFAEFRKKSSGVLSSRNRPTRNPMFHRNPEEVYDIEDGQSSSESPSNDQRQATKLEQDSEIKENLRPYFFDKFTMARLKHIMFLGMTTGTFPWKWDNSKHRIVNFSPIYSKCWKLFRVLFAIQTCCITVFQMNTFWQLATSGKVTNREIFIASFNMMWYLEWIDFALNMYFYGEQIREYINTVLKFNYDMVQKYVIHLDGHQEGGRILMKFALQCDFNAVLIKVMYFLKMSYAPWYLFSHISPKPWYWLIPGAIQSYWFNGQVITSYTLVYWLVVAHTNTIQFWLTETHNNNNSDYTSDEIRKQKTSMEVYKSLQVLNTCFNDCVAPLFIPIIKLHAGVVAVVCGYIMVRNMNHYFIDEFPMSLIFLTGFMVSTVESFVMLNMSSQIFDLGCGFVWSWSFTNDKELKTTLTSCSTPKVYVRRFYYITVDSLISFFQIVSDNIINALLTFV